jgi:ABC-2 type transport system ATP-binding protein
VARTDGPVLDPAWDVSELTLEDVVLDYLGADQSEPVTEPAVEVVA